MKIELTEDQVLPWRYVMEWQLIETAPKDGTDVLIWEQYSSTPVVARYFVYKDRLGQDIGKWLACREHYDVDGDACLVDRLSQELITHWMPLPVPPVG